MAVLRERPDVTEAFPDLDGGDVEALITWLWTDGRAEMELDDELLPPRAEPGAPRPAVLEVEVAGYMDAHLGLGQSGRSYTKALEAAGLPVGARNIHSLVMQVSGEEVGRPAQRAYSRGVELERPAVSLVCLNAPQLLTLPEADRATLLDPARYRIGVWAWETDAVPTYWSRAYEELDEVWVYSEYVRSVLAPTSPVPVVVAPLCLDLADASQGSLPAEVPTEGFLFLCSFDLHSTIQRKNPLGTIAAFRDAFSPGEGPVLLVKTINADARPEQEAALRAAAAGREDIVLLDAELSSEDLAALMERADCYVSLHRSEGWGIAPAEALARGKAVVATRFSGVLDFLDEDTSFLVDHELISDVEIYPPDGRWADPVHADAVAALRRVVDDPAEAAARTARGQERITAALAPEAVGGALRARLEAVVPDALARRAAEAPVDRFGAVREALAARSELAPLPGLPEGRRTQVTPALWAALQERLAAADALTNTLVDVLEERTAADAEATRARTSAARRTVALERRLVDLERQAGHERALREGLTQALAVVQQRSAASPEPAELTRLVAGSRAVPYLDDPLVRDLVVPEAGRVLGYAGGSAVAPEDRYRAFEDGFRGSRDRVAEMMALYLPILGPDAGPVLELGSGRGEFVAVLRGAGLEVEGSDPDAGMLAAARAAGIALREGDALTVLRDTAPGSLGTVFAAHVIEHLPLEDLLAVLDLARDRLRPGGRLVVETVNPHAVHALKTFWVDLTHHHPIFPEVALSLARSAGFSAAYITYPGGTGDHEADRFGMSSWTLVAER